MVTYDRTQLNAFVSDRLARILTHAFTTVPYYRETWSASGYKQGSPITGADLQALPILTKDDIRARKADLMSDRYVAGALDIDFTGGTVGTQTSFYRDRECGIAKLGRQWGILERCGYKPGYKRGLVWGAHQDLSPPGRRGFKQRIRHFADAEEVLCCTTMSRADLQQYYRRLLRFRPTVVYGYPTALYELARYILENRDEPLHVNRVICTAELLTDARRQLFADVFGGEVFNLYCSREHGCLGFECARHDGFHVDAGSVVIEIIRDGRPAAPGERGEIVTTDLLNYGGPLVRYATGDLATACEAICDCGLSLPLISSVDGRVADALLRPDGRMVAGLMLTDLFEDFAPVRAAQFVQEAEGVLDVRVVIVGELTREIRAHIVREVRTIMGDEISINVHSVPEIPRSPNSGKYREVICRIDRGAGQAEAEASHAG